jgi:chromosome partitioning protein
VGKTTTSINLAACLALSGRKTLLVDMDPQSNASSGLGRTLAGDQSGVYELLTGSTARRAVTYPTEIEALKIIPATVHLSGAELELATVKSREKVLKAALSGVEDEYEFVIIDCPPALGLLTLNALAASNSVLIPMQCEYYSLQGLSHLLNTLKLVKQSINPDLIVEGILLTMFDGRTSLASQVRNQVAKYFKEFLLKTVIPRNIRLSEAPSHGKPIVLYDRKSKGADAYIELASELVSKLKNSSQHQSVEAEERVG